MKKGNKILVLLGVLLVCIVAYRFVGTLNEKEDKKEEIALFDVKTEDINQVEWSYSGVDFTIEKSTGDWKWDADPIFPVDQERAGEMAEKIATLKATRELDDENIDEYGLGSVRTIKAIDKNGKEYSVSVGKENTMTSESYVYINDDKTKIYTVDATFVSSFDKIIDDIMKKEEVGPVENINSFKIESGENNFTLTKNEEGVWTDGEKDLDDTKVMTLIGSFTNISWKDCDSYSADDAKKTERGFDAPFAKVTITGDKDDVTLLFGKQENGIVYAKLYGSNMIYTVDETIKDSINTKADTLIADTQNSENTENTENE